MSVQRPAPIREQVATAIRDAIVELRIRPGDSLVERELCEATGASRASVREALRQLESEGLITSVPGKGACVATISISEARDLYAVREALEGLAGRLFTTHATLEQRRWLAEVVDELAAIDSSTIGGPEILSVKARFYEILLEGTRNRELRRMLDIVHRRVSLLRSLTMTVKGRFEVAFSELQAIVEAVQDNDPDAASLACMAHVREAAKVADTLLDSTGDTTVAI